MDLDLWDCFGRKKIRLIIISAQKVSVAQQVKSWPADLAVLSLIPAGSGNLYRKWDSFAHSLSFSPSYRPDMTGILMKRA